MANISRYTEYSKTSLCRTR